MAEFRKASNDLKRTINTELALDEPAAPPVRPWLEPPAQTTPRSPQPALAPIETVDSAEPDDTPSPPEAETSSEPLEPR
jgi:hypothetical protein